MTRRALSFLVKGTYSLFVMIALASHLANASDAVQLSSSSSSVAANKDSAGAFVQDFYDWYAPMAFRQKNSLPWEQAITLKANLFSSKLKIVLNIDKHSGKDSDGVYTGLDFDPFLNSFNPCERYVVAEVMEYEKSFRVAMQAVCNGKLQQKNIVWAEVSYTKKSQWQFVNFHYPESNDLIAVLKNLRKRRHSDIE
jgi:hypothetical protein